MTTEKPPPTAPPGTVCRRCWHGLKGLNTASVCPECREPVAHSLDAEWWGNGPIEPLHRIASSLGACLAGCVAFLLYYAGAMVVEHYQLADARPTWVEASIAIATTALWCWLALALRRAALATRTSCLAGGWAVRTAAFTAALSCPLLVLVEGLSFAFPYGFPGWWQAAPLAFVVTSSAMLLCWTVVQDRAVRQLNRRTLTLFSWLQLAAASATIGGFAAGLTLEFAKDIVDFRPDWVYPLRAFLENATKWSLGALLLLAALNIDLLRISMRRVIQARKSAE